MLETPKSGNPDVNCYFITGTGRSGTMLLSEVLSCSSNTHCNHEHSVQTLVMKNAYYRGDYTQLNDESVRTIDGLVAEYSRNGKSYGECSAHIFPIIPALQRRYGASARFALMVRRPDSFVGSALARGFFDPSHPNPCEHVRPSPKTEVGRQWDVLTPFDKCLWYWNTVNTTVLNTFRQLPAGTTRVIRMEDVDLPEVERLFEFFGLADFQDCHDEVRGLIGTRINASPGQGDDRSLNPWSREISVADSEGWTSLQRDAMLQWAGALARVLYPDWMQETFGSAR